MGFRCSILGCEYEHAGHEREREQRGEEVVLTVREYEECRHCGDRRLISENTGVVSAPDAAADGGESALLEGFEDEPDPDPEPAADSDGWDSVDQDGVDAPGADALTPDPEEMTDDERVPDPEDDDAVLLETGETDGPSEAGELDVGVDPDAAESEPDLDEAMPEDGGVEFIGADGPDDATAEEPTSDPAAAVEAVDAEGETTVVDPDDDAAVVDAAPESAERTAQADARTETTAAGDDGAGLDGFGDWPDEDPASDPEYDHGTWPDPTDGARDEPASAATGASLASEPSAGDEDATVLDDGTSGTANVASASTTATAGADSSAASTDGHDATVEHGPGAQTTRTDVDGELHCRSCGYTVPPSGTPHRAGDICPDCASGYLNER